MSPGRERWFLALWPDAVVRATLAEAARALLPKAVRITHPQDLHLTLRFLGPLSPKGLERVGAAVDRVAGSPAVPLCVDRLGFFSRAGVLWAGPAVANPALLDLVTRLEEALALQGFAPESRPFRAHITLARRVRGRPRQVWGVAVPWLARELVLAAGQEGQRPRYRVRRAWPLSVLDPRPPDPGALCVRGGAGALEGAPKV